MRLSRAYLRARGALLLAFASMLAIFLATFALWHLPMQVLGNATALAILIFLLALTVDFWRYRRGRAELLALTAKLEQLTEDKNAQSLAGQELTDIVRVWSHQMKVPLAAIQLMAETEVNAEALQQQVFSLDSSLRLLLETLRIKNLASDFHFEEVAVADVLRDLIKKYSPFFIAKGLTVRLDGDWRLVTDARWLSVALEQVLSNAVKYTVEGGVTLTLSDGRLVLADSGRGILAEDLPRLFEHGFTGYNGRRGKESTGLGLYLAKLIFDKLGLTVAIRSQVGVGTRVTVEKGEK